jgi:hypothetical protein
MPRTQILTASELKSFDALPVLSYAERDTLFQVSERLGTILATLRNPTNRVALVLTVGYFRATKRFFTPPFDPIDVAYVAKRLDYTLEHIDFEAYDAKASASRHRQLTLDYLGFRPFKVVYQAAADIISRPLPCRLSEGHQPAISTRDRFSGSRLCLLACI